MINNTSNLLDKLRPTPSHWVMFITAIGMGLSLIFHVFIPRYLGINETADALIASFKVVLIVDTIIREGAKFSLVPLFINEANIKNRQVFCTFSNGILNFSLCISLVFMLLIEVFAVQIAKFTLSSSSADTHAMMVTLLRISAPIVIFGTGSSVLGALLNSQRKFKTVAIRNALPPASAIACLVLLSGEKNLVPYIAIAYTTGFVVYYGWLCISTYQIGYGYRFSWITSEALRTLKETISFPTLGFAIRQITARIVVEIILVGKIANGAITLYNSAFKIFSAIQSLIGISIATTGLPEMTENSIEENKQKLKQTLIRNIRSVLFIAVPATFFLVLSSTHITQMLFGGGKFNIQSLQTISRIIIWLSIGTVFSCLIPVLNAGLYAQKEYQLIFRNMLTMACINFVVAYILVTVWELNGIAITVSVTAILAVGNLVYLLRKTGVSLYSKS